ncbi:helix-turn-helix domain-containing protein [Stenoxybacter acetivorans]|uniref:helix-turn-helix domain-containing protein n=1 Tax=Stenoxybacter acetivorans TaxID=422441 RepID=UPI0005626430|nr:helix-turn-helix domain-containing protein [Stenoxybacter acetivorans]
MDTVKIIRTEADYEATVQRLEQLMDNNPPTGSEENDELDALACLLEAYENKHYMIVREPITALEVIKFQMEQNDLSQKGMEAYLGSPSKVSEVLNGKRALSLSMIKKLHQGLHIPADLLLDIRV